MKGPHRPPERKKRYSNQLSRLLRSLAFATALALPILATGCAASRPRPVVDPASLDTDTFLAWLADQPMVGAAEAYRAGIILATGTDPGYDWQKLQQQAYQLNLARPEWNLTADTAIDKGTAAFIICQACKVRGGINLNLFGRTLHLGDRRYAWRELIYEGLVRDGSPYHVVTGGEFVALLAKADEWREKSKTPLLQVPATQPEAATSQASANLQQ